MTSRMLEGDFGEALNDGQVGIDEGEAVAALLERLDVVQAMFHGFDYSLGIIGPPAERLKVLAGAVNFILEKQHDAAREAKSDEARKLALRRFQDAVVGLSKAFALSSATDAARRSWLLSNGQGCPG